MLRFEKIMHVIKMKRYVTENRTYGMLENAGKMEKISETVCKTVCQYNKNSIKAEAAFLSYIQAIPSKMK